jgi:hypothetical protein
MNRRTFLRLMSGLSLVVLDPVRAFLRGGYSSAVSKSSQITKVLTPEQGEALKSIQRLEIQLRQQHGEFSWALHNELRHLYGTIDEAKSLEHANAILARSVMDTYILHTLSDWYDEPSYQPCNPKLAIASLLRRVEEYPNLKYIRIACLIKAADICASNRQLAIARQLYQRALNGSGWRTTRGLQAYCSLARSKIAQYSEL